MLESRAGLTALLSAFVFTGITGALTSSLLGSHHIISVGASGAIFGILGFNAVYGLYQAQDWWDRLKISLLYVFMNLFGTFFIANVDHFAHLGGLLGGFILGFLWRQPPVMARRFLLLASLGLLGFGWWLTMSHPVNTTANTGLQHPVQYCFIHPSIFGAESHNSDDNLNFSEANSLKAKTDSTLGAKFHIVPCPTQ